MAEYKIDEQGSQYEECTNCAKRLYYEHPQRYTGDGCLLCVDCHRKLTQPKYDEFAAKLENIAQLRLNRLAINKYQASFWAAVAAAGWHGQAEAENAKLRAKVDTPHDKAMKTVSAMLDDNLNLRVKAIKSYMNTMQSLTGGKPTIQYAKAIIDHYIAQQ